MSPFLSRDLRKDDHVMLWRHHNVTFSSLVCISFNEISLKWLSFLISRRTAILCLCNSTFTKLQILLHLLHKFAKLWIWPAELHEWTCVCRTVWFVELAYCACVSHARNPYVNSSAVNQREYRTFDVIKSIAIECVRAQPGLHKVSTILGAVMHSRNSKTIVYRRSDSDWMTIVSVTQVPILTQTRCYQPVKELNLTMKVSVNRPRKQYVPQASWFASFVQIWWFVHFHSRKCTWKCRLENGGPLRCVPSVLIGYMRVLFKLTPFPCVNLDMTLM